MTDETHTVDSRSRFFLREFVSARRRGNEVAVQRHWGDLLREEWARVPSAVRAAAGSTLHSEAEILDAISETADRLGRLGAKNFHESTLGQFRAYVRTVANTACLDVQRKASRRKEDATHEDEDPLRWERVQADAHRRERDLQGADDGDGEDPGGGRDFLAWALPQLSEKRRRVIECLLEGKKPEEIADLLGMERNTVDQNKRRALQDLNKLKEQWTP